MEQEPVTQIERNQQFGFERKIRFNGEITLGHVLTAITMISLLFGVWRNFEVRMVKLEQITQFQSGTIAAIMITLEKMEDERRGSR